MAGTPTPTYAFPIPAATDPADVPTDLGALATKVDTVLNGSAPWGVKFGTPNNGLTFGGDTNLYRYQANYLGTDGRFDAYAGATNYAFSARMSDPANQAGLITYVRAENYPRFQISGVGMISWGPGVGALDTTLYRGNAGQVWTDGVFVAKGSIYAGYPTANQITISTDGRIYFGNGNDTNLYRIAQKTLQTDSIFSVYADDAAWATGDTGLYIYIHNIGQKRVLVGAADSGGSGRRALTVAN